MAHYFQMLDDVHVPGRWYLVHPQDRDGTDIEPLLWEGRLLDVQGPIRVHFSRFAPRGKPIDYSEMDGAPSAPVVHTRVAAILSQLGSTDVQLIPAVIEEIRDRYLIVNVTRTIRCIDDKASAEVRYYTQEDAKVFPDMVGTYKSVIGLRIDTSKVGEARIFRTWGWDALVVSAEVKQALERIGTVGVKFEEV